MNINNRPYASSCVQLAEQFKLNPFPTEALEQATTPKRRIEWEDSELEAVAKAFVSARCGNPFESPILLANQAQEEALAEDRRRKLVTLPTNLRAKIMNHWRSTLAKEADEHPPVVLTVEVPKPFDYTEALNNFDCATLVALLMGKLGKEVGAIQNQLAGITEGLGSRPSVAPQPALKLPAVFAKPEKHKPRIAIIGPLPGQMNDIQKQVDQVALPVELRFVDKEASSPSLPTSCDFAIVTRHNRHKWFDAARQQLENGRVYFVDGGITQLVQKVRDICSRQ